MEAANFNGVLEQDDENDEVSDSQLENDTTLEYTVAPSTLLSPGAAPEAQAAEEAEWRRAAQCSVLRVRCKKLSGELVRSRFGSGTKGRSIRLIGSETSRKQWLTPTEFEIYAGRSKSKDWKRSIKFRGRPIQALIEAGLLAVHTIGCSCPTCIDDPKAAGPVKLLQQMRRQRKTQQPSPLTISSDEGSSVPQTITIPANILSQIGLSISNVDLSDNSITVPVQQPVSSAQAGYENSQLALSKTIVLNSNSTNIQSVSSSTAPTIFFSGSSLKSGPITFPVNNVPNQPDSIVVPIVDTSDKFISNPEPIVLTNNHIDFSLNDDDDDSSSRSNLIVPSPSLDKKPTVALDFGSATSAPPADINQGISNSNLSIKPKMLSNIISSDRHQFSQVSTSRFRKVPKIIDINVINSKNKTTSPMLVNTTPVANFKVLSNSSTMASCNAKFQTGSFKNEYSSSSFETSLNKLDEIVSGLEKGLQDARSELAALRTAYSEGISPQIFSNKNKSSPPSGPLLDSHKKSPLLSSRHSPVLPPSLPPLMLITPEEDAKKCTNCDRPCRLQCTGCPSRSFYCSNFCQKKDWHFHSVSCTGDVEEKCRNYLYL